MMIGLSGYGGRDGDMILSVSRRTDIPAHYAEWFFNRIRDGFALVRNPMNFHHVSRINITPDAVDGIVFWTKDPTPMLPRLGELARYHYYFQFTLNSYAADVEPGVCSKAGHIIPTFKRLSDMIGPERVIWRYDPILINEKYTSAYHIKYFERLARSLRSFIAAHEKTWRSSQFTLSCRSGSPCWRNPSPISLPPMNCVWRAVPKTSSWSTAASLTDAAWTPICWGKSPATGLRLKEIKIKGRRAAVRKASISGCTAPVPAAADTVTRTGA